MTHYELLAVPRDASLDTIRTSYAAQMNQWANSTDPSAEQRRHQIQSAYVVLSDPELRATYDARLAQQTTSIPMSATRMPTAGEMAAYENQPAAVLARDAFEAKRWAGFWIRYAAELVDGIVMLIPVLGLSTAMAFLFGMGHKPPLSLPAFYLTEVILFSLYSAWLNSSVNLGTVGRRAAGIAVVSDDTGEQISFGRALGRGVLSFFCAVLVFPNLLQLFTPRRQSLADLLTGTVVVKKRPAGGFIVVVIVLVVLVGVVFLGILAGIAVPAYQDYTTRARVTQALTLASSYKTLVAQNVSDKAADLSQGFIAPPANANMAEVDISSAGVITVTMTPINKNVTFALYPSLTSNGLPASTAASAGGTITWTCRVNQASNDRYVPTECRI